MEPIYSMQYRLRTLVYSNWVQHGDVWKTIVQLDHHDEKFLDVIRSNCSRYPGWQLKTEVSKVVIPATWTNDHDKIFYDHKFLIHIA